MLAVVAACSSGGGDPCALACPDGDADPAECTEPPCDDVVAVVPTTLNRDLDILFMIDNSGSMAEEQVSLGNNFHRMITVLETVEGGLPNVHIGIVSSDVGAGPFNITSCSGNGDNGILQNAPRYAGCAPPAGQFISDIANPDGSRLTNYTDPLVETFGCIARLGIDGCGFEQPLEAVRRALNGSNAQNAGFLRQDALLAVILLTDEDDCSTENTQMFDTSQTMIDDPLGPLSSFRCFEFGVTCDPDEPRAAGLKASCQSREDSAYMYPVQEYVDFLRGLKSDPRKVIVAGVMGDAGLVVVGADENGYPKLDPSCDSSGGSADPPVRLRQFLDGFPRRNTVATICQDDPLRDALTYIAEQLKFTIGSPCLVGPLTMPLDCTVEDVQDLGAANEQRTEIPPCDDPAVPGNPPCYVIAPDTDRCPDTDTSLSIEITRGGAVPPVGTSVVVTCKVDALPQ
jgi:hypothetical protein